jgi:hypothetical protein
MEIEFRAHYFHPPGETPYFAVLAADAEVVESWRDRAGYTTPGFAPTATSPRTFRPIDGRWPATIEVELGIRHGDLCRVRYRRVMNGGRLGMSLREVARI